MDEDLTQLFFDEATEQLDDLESQLSGLSANPGDAERLNSAFRAVHSVKGAANLVGFERIAAFAHKYESFLHKLRSKQITADEAVVELLLRGRDILHDLIEHARTGSEASNDAEAAVTARFDSGAAVTPAVEGPRVEQHGNLPKSRIIRARLAPKLDGAAPSGDPDRLFAQLRRRGRLSVIADTSAVPSLDRLDIGSMLISWTMELDTGAALGEVQEIFAQAAWPGEYEVIDCGETPVELPREETVASPPEADTPAVPDMPGLVTAPASAVESTAESVPLASSIRVDVERMDRLVNLVGELVISQSMLAEQLQKLPTAQFAELSRGIQELTRHARRLQEGVMAIRAQPVQSVFSRMPKLVRELASQTGKRLRLETVGEDTEIDKTVIEQLYDPITHMIRNAADHGIESPEERQAAGKQPAGTIRLSAGHSGGRIVIQVADDGRGIDRRRVRAKAEAAGLVSAADELTDDEIDNLIFLPGLSTAREISSISGRGVGMDVVRQNIHRLGGRVTIRSVPGQGSVFFLTLPLTLAVLDGMIVRVGPEKYVVPLGAIIESLRPRARDVHTLVGGADVLSIRGQYVPLVYLHDTFGVERSERDAAAGLVMLVETDAGARIGLVVDEILGQQQVVIKSLESNYRAISGVAGATILGNGRVALIINVSGLVTETNGRDAAEALAVSRAFVAQGESL